VAVEINLQVRLMSNEKYFRHPVSNTFHGRDIFAPAAARLAADLKPEFEKPHRAGKRTWIARSLKIDRFGNIITNIHSNDFGDLALRNFSLGPQTVTVLAQNYAQCAPGELYPCASLLECRMHKLSPFRERLR
jgi:S-adenosylmethionine hydrolase